MARWRTMHRRRARMLARRRAAERVDFERIFNEVFPAVIEQMAANLWAHMEKQLARMAEEFRALALGPMPEDWPSMIYDANEWPDVLEDEAEGV